MVSFTQLSTALAFVLAGVNGDPVTDRIIGGTNVVDDYKFLTSLQSTRGSHFCGGSLISKTAVLTAAHCVSNGNTNFQIFLDSETLGSGGITVRPKKVFVHENYDSRTIRNDIAMIELSTPVTSVTPIAIDYTSTNAQVDAMKDITIAGWGRTSGGGSSPRIMQEVTLDIVPDSTCKAAGSPFNNMQDASMVCIGKRDGSQTACNGDSGGPMFNAQTNVQIGLTSWGAQGCPSYAVYTQLPFFESWIKEKLAIIGDGPGSTPAPTTDGGSGGDACKCVGSGEGLDVGETCGNWLNQSFDWCYSDVACPGSTPSQRYTGYHWFRCNRSRLDMMIDFENMENNHPVLINAGPSEDFGTNESVGSEGLGLLAGVGIGVAAAGVVSAGLFTVYKKQRDAAIENAIDRVEAERRVVSSQFDKSDV